MEPVNTEETFDTAVSIEAVCERYKNLYAGLVF